MTGDETEAVGEASSAEGTESSEVSAEGMESSEVSVEGMESSEIPESPEALAGTPAAERTGVWPRRLRLIELLAVGCVAGGVGFAFLDGQPPLAAVLGGGTLGGLVFLLATAALLVYWSVVETVAG